MDFTKKWEVMCWELEAARLNLRAKELSMEWVNRAVLAICWPGYAGTCLEFWRQSCWVGFLELLELLWSIQILLRFIWQPLFSLIIISEIKYIFVLELPSFIHMYIRFIRFLMLIVDYLFIAASSNNKCRFLQVPLVTIELDLYRGVPVGRSTQIMGGSFRRGLNSEVVTFSTLARTEVRPFQINSLV